MIIQIDAGTTIDTDSDLSPAERHVLQKLLCYKSFVSSIAEFREKTARALEVGWNDSGPVAASGSLKLVICQLEEQVTARQSGEYRKEWPT